MKNKRIYIFLLGIMISGCKVPRITNQGNALSLPLAFQTSIKADSSIAKISWRNYFSDPMLINLIDTALVSNQDMAKALQHIEMARSGIIATRGALKPVFEGVGVAGIQKYGLYTMDGAGNRNTEMINGKDIPVHLTDFLAGFQASWEIDLFGKLRNKSKAAQARFWASVEAKNLIATSIVSEIALAYYELLALDNQLSIIDEYIRIQENAVELARVQKEANTIDELAVKQFEAQLLNLQEMKFDVYNSIIENESKINFLIGRYPRIIPRTSTVIETLLPKIIATGVPSDLLLNRPDLRQAELNLNASRIDVQVARAAFLPSLNINALLGLQAFRPDLLISKPQSLAYSLLGGLAAPLINKSAIQADFNYASASQLEALYDYNQRIVGAYIEVYNQLAIVNNLNQSYQLKARESEVLGQTIEISNELFRNNRATYLDVLVAQQNALETRLSLVQIRKSQLQSSINIYKALGGGWK
jgi:NodT family efflux transporter outer membrane factor (OMF) lipoprotein